MSEEKKRGRPRKPMVRVDVGEHGVRRRVIGGPSHAREPKPKIDRAQPPPRNSDVDAVIARMEAAEARKRASKPKGARKGKPEVPPQNAALLAERDRLQAQLNELTARANDMEQRLGVVSGERDRTATERDRTVTELAELREAKKRIRLLEQENEVLRRAAAYLSQANLPGKGSTRS